MTCLDNCGLERSDSTEPGGTKQGGSLSQIMIL